tara:strand:+ start:2617 stop:3582 length:966 start_codon:yes stop_codon:yes gene_type:complete
MKLIKNKKLIFRFDIGNKDGLGHYNRSIILINYFIKKNFTVKICTNTKSKKFFNKNLIKNIFLKKKNENEDTFINRISAKFTEYIIFIDKAHEFKKKDLVNLKKKNQIIIIQNIFKSSEIADKIIFPDIHNKTKYKKNKIFTGLKFFLLREEIYKTKNISQNNNLAVTFGGSDPYNLTTKILKILKKIKWEEKTYFHIGKAYSNEQKISLTKEIKKHKNFYISKFNIKNIIKSRIVISSFSTLSYEMAYLKKINFVLLLRKKINIPSNIFFKNTINLGYYSNITSEMLKNSLYKHWKIDNIIENVKIKNNATTEYLKILQS